MDNYKSELLGTVETVSEFAGGLAGKVVVYSRGITDHLKDMMLAKPETKPEEFTKAVESTKILDEDKLAETQEPAAKQHELEDTENAKSSSGSQGCPKPKAGKKTKIAAKSQKRQPSVTRKTKSSVTPSGPTGKS